MNKSIDQLLEESVAAFSSGSSVDAACLYAVRGGGRIRPLIVEITARHLRSAGLFRINCPGCEESAAPSAAPSAALNAALCIELLHCASLIADDLPCMDDDETRRERPTCHIAFSQEVALLASYKLIALAYQALSNISAEIPQERHNLALKIVSARSAQMIDGQYYDLQFESKKSAPKTTALFQAAFALGWIYGGGALDEIEPLEEAAALFGEAFQIADDIEDGDLTSRKRWSSLLAKRLSQAKRGLKKIGLLPKEMADLINQLKTS